MEHSCTSYKPVRFVKAEYSFGTRDGSAALIAGIRKNKRTIFVVRWQDIAEVTG
jgi:hypothetical protein